MPEQVDTIVKGWYVVTMNATRDVIRNGAVAIKGRDMMSYMRTLPGVVDTNNSPDGIEYVIPGNDDSARAIRLYARGIADAVLEGRAQAIQEIVNAAANASAAE